MIDKSWVCKDKLSQEYNDGVLAFIDYGYAYGTLDEKRNLRCPCINCKNFDFRDRDIIFEHLVCDGMLGTYSRWTHHGVGIGMKPKKKGGVSATSSNNDEEIRDLREEVELFHQEREEIQREREELLKAREEMQKSSEEINKKMDKMIEFFSLRSAGQDISSLFSTQH